MTAIGMSVAAEALEEAGHLLMDHRVMRHAVVEIFLLRLGRQFAVQQQVAGLEKVTLLGELFDRIAAVKKNAGVAVDVGDLGVAASGGGKAGIVSEHPGLGVELTDVDDVRADRAAQDGKSTVFPSTVSVAFLVLVFASIVKSPVSVAQGKKRCLRAYMAT